MDERPPPVLPVLVYLGVELVFDGGDVPIPKPPQTRVDRPKVVISCNIWLENRV